MAFRDYDKLTKEELISQLVKMREAKPLPSKPDEVGRLVNELQVHQIELEMQNRELKESRGRLEESLDRYAEFYDFAPVGYATVDSKWRIEDINLTAASMLGVERSMLKGRPLSGFVEKRDMKTFLDHIRRCRFIGGKIVTELYLKVKNGPAICVELLTVPLSRDAAYFKTIISDITARKNAEREREAMQAQLSQLQKVETIGRLAGGIAHDFNNLIIIIKMNNALAAREVDADSPTRAYMRQIDEACGRASSLTRQLLIYSSRVETRPELIDLNQTVIDMLKILDRLIGESIAIKRELDPDIYSIRADKSNIEQMIMNLVINARDVMPGGGEVVIKTRRSDAGSGNEAVCLIVTDMGPGMDKEVVEHIFEPFFTTKGAGKGLGLAVVNSVVKENNGTIGVESAPGQGTTFNICFPGVPERPKPEGKEEAAEELTGKGERVLVVEDEAPLRRSIGLILVRSGYKVFQASDVKEAISVFKSESAELDLVLSDIGLRDGNGLQLVKELSSWGKKPGVIFMSGYMDVESQWPEIRDRGYGFLRKPFEIDEMLRMVRKTLADKGG